MNKQQKQLSFTKGMIENIKQDLPNEVNPVFDSALWIENMNPNIQRDSLVARSEQTHNLHTTYADSLGDPGIIDLGRYSALVAHAITSYATNNISYERLREILLTSSTYLLTSRPIENDTYLLFVRRFTGITEVYDGLTMTNDRSIHGSIVSEATAVIAWVGYVDSSGNFQYGWREPFRDGEVYPGWYALGTYQDHARYGESVIFVTLPLLDMNTGGNPAAGSPYALTDDAKTKYHPCYIWQFWDLHKKRDGINGDQLFWNGLDVGDLNDPKYRVWKIRKPSTAIIKEDLVEAIALWKHDTGVWTDLSGVVKTSLNNKKIQLCFWESPLRTMRSFDQAYLQKLFDEYKDARFENGIEYVYENPYFLNKTIGSIESIETIDVENLYGDGSTQTVRRNAQGTGQSGGALVSFDIDPSPTQINLVDLSAVAFPTNVSGSDPNWPYDSGNTAVAKYQRYKIDTFKITKDNQEKSIEACVVMPPDGAPSISTDLPFFDEQEVRPAWKITNPYNSSTDNSDASSVHWQRVDDDDNTENEACIVGSRLPNYLEAEIPRQWLCGETIPFLLTATVNGVEVVLLKDIYTVGSQNYLMCPSLYNPFWWDFMDNNDIDLFGDWPILASRCNGFTELYSAAEVHYQQWVQASTGWKLNGKKLLHSYVSGFYAALTGSHPSQPSHAIFHNFSDETWPPAKLRTRHEPLEYMYEPFNPTNEIGILDRFANPGVLAKRFVKPVHTSGLSTGLTFGTSAGSWGLNMSPGLYDSGYSDFGFFIPKVIEGNMVHFGLRIESGFWDEISSMNISAFNLYVSKPDLQSSILRSVGLIDIQDAPNGLYPKSKVTKDNILASQDFALVKTWLIEGKGTPGSHWESYKGAPISTNAWYDDGTYAWAVPQKANGDARTALPPFIDHCTGGYSELTADSQWTPDFMLWDYPVLGKSLSLNSNGEYWQGLGSRLIAVIKGRTFISDPDEPGLVRYSDVQSGVAAQDIFSEANKIKIGHNAHTAFVEYREQLWFFSRFDNYRLQFHNVYDESTWEFLDTVSMGTFASKTVTVTPYGIVYCNEAGVWISDGRIPQNIALPILPSYQRLVRENDVSNSFPEFDPEVAFIGEYVDSDGNSLKVYNGDNGFNEYLELAYDTLHDEIAVCTPMWEYNTGEFRWIAKREYRLIYSFANQNWRVESYDIPKTEPA